MSQRDPKLMLSEIIESVAAIQSYLKGVDKGEFAGNALLQDAITRRLEILGEAANQIPNAMKQRFPEVEWREITAMRNRLIHGYFSVNIDIVWSTVKQDIQKLATQAQAMLDQLELDDTED